MVIIEHGRIRMVLRKVKKRKREKIDGARKCWCNRMSFIDKNIYINNICVQVLWLKRRQQLLRKSFFLRISGNGIKAISFILVSSTPCIYFSVGFFHLALLIFSLFHFSQHFFALSLCLRFVVYSLILPLNREVESAVEWSVISNDVGSRKVSHQVKTLQTVC